MDKLITIYHGSEKIVDQPIFGEGKINNDFGLGFYCTESEKLAKEWATVQGTYFKQCRQCAEVMGLSISSRCRLSVPDALVNAARDEGGEDEFTRALRARQARAVGSDQ